MFQLSLSDGKQFDVANQRSMGANLLVKLAGQLKNDIPLKALVSISNPLDFPKSNLVFKKPMNKLLYSRTLADSVKSILKR
jgi:predicted alpha/beta-fold hydrolase